VSAKLNGSCSHAAELTAAALGRPLRRQDAQCQDRLQCFGFELYSEANVLLDSGRFDGTARALYVFYFYKWVPLVHLCPR
jgi:hypothetical protein